MYYDLGTNIINGISSQWGNEKWKMARKILNVIIGRNVLKLQVPKCFFKRERGKNQIIFLVIKKYKIPMSPLFLLGVKLQYSKFVT